MSDVWSIKTLFLDIGGVLLTNGWDHAARLRVAKTFNLDYNTLDERHHQAFDTIHYKIQMSKSKCQMNAQCQMSNKKTHNHRFYLTFELYLAFEL